MRLVVIGDIHAQEDKLWRMLDESGLRDEGGAPTPELLDGTTRLVLLGDLVHAKSRAIYAQLAGVTTYDEYDPGHVRRVERAQEAFLHRVHAFLDPVPDGIAHVLLGNHDHNAVEPHQGPLRSDDISHLEWKPGYGSHLPEALAAWIRRWPRSLEVEGIHLAHVGPREEHNVFDNDFYRLNRRRWIYEDHDYLAETPHRLGVYGHTPVRGGLNVASQGKALLLDANGYGDEYAWLDVRIDEDAYRVRLRGLVFDEVLAR
ncbi:MAG: metallophosphoesterase [Trueperaceae bacterium]|nr:metallophosphoesterase [Trueperaceae bacterium]